MTTREKSILILAVLVIAVLLYFYRSNTVEGRNYQQERDSLATLYDLTLDSISTLNNRLSALDTLISRNADTIRVVEERIKYIPLKYEKQYKISRNISVDSLQLRLWSRLDSVISRASQSSRQPIDSTGRM